MHVGKHKALPRNLEEEDAGPRRRRVIERGVQPFDSVYDLLPEIFKGWKN